MDQKRNDEHSFFICIGRITYAVSLFRMKVQNALKNPKTSMTELGSWPRHYTNVIQECMRQDVARVSHRLAKSAQSGSPYNLVKPLKTEKVFFTKVETNGLIMAEPMSFVPCAFVLIATPWVETNCPIVDKRADRDD